MTLARLRLSRGAQPPPSAGPADMSRKMQASSVTLFEMLDKGSVGSLHFCSPLSMALSTVVGIFLELFGCINEIPGYERLIWSNLRRLD
jgi:hypothetical protein